ncbi:hypothetical protein NIES21_15270 [Anabaenopsis circularis NIES-21]|uniref:Uncharacterized protein n=1 Tax=Anabaenopsis circularis NIES-21 TaxID=1085406 RepID=A0A1Z4GEF0_9CYAN|nr:hypothetical protein NIES21_15270 [Anabaenopsis circularis NIES-21]
MTYSHFIPTNPGVLIIPGEINESGFNTFGTTTIFKGTKFNDASFFDAKNEYQNHFGMNFKQDENNIYIAKVDLSDLTASNHNSAQSLVVALLNKWQSLKTESQVHNIDLKFWGGVVRDNIKTLTLEIFLYDYVSSDGIQITEYPNTNIDPNKY